VLEFNNPNIAFLNHHVLDEKLMTLPKIVIKKLPPHHKNIAFIHFYNAKQSLPLFFIFHLFGEDEHISKRGEEGGGEESKAALSRRFVIRFKVFTCTCRNFPTKSDPKISTLFLLTLEIATAHQLNLIE
jgi:hypothetical protein